MMHWLAQFGYFVACTVTLVAAILAVFAGITAMTSKAKSKAKGQLTVKKLNKHYEKTCEQMQESILSKSQLKESAKALKKQEKAKSKKKTDKKPRMYVLRFHGDIRASDCHALTESINALLLVATKKDHVLLCLESGGGLVPNYGLASSQLLRIKQAGIKLTIAIDKVAASGGYMMACVADHIIAAPFAIVGSIGVIVQLPNIHRLLKQKHIDFEQLTAGQYKRTLTVLGENTDQGRAKMQQEINETHDLFKQHINHCRPQVDLEQVATGEHWYGQQALDLKLVDELQTSDDFLLSQRNDFHLFEIRYKIKLPLSKKITAASESLLAHLSTASSQTGIH